MLEDEEAREGLKEEVVFALFLRDRCWPDG